MAHKTALVKEGKNVFLTVMIGNVRGRRPEVDVEKPG